MTFTQNTPSYNPSFTDANAASYVSTVAKMAMEEARRLLKKAKLLITWKIANCGDLDSAGDVTNAFKDVMAIRTKADFIEALLEIRTAAEEFTQTWYRAARCRRTIKICADQGFTVTPEQVESTEVAMGEQYYSCQKAAAELLSLVAHKTSSL